MSTTSTDPADIEADLERDRASLASTLDALSDRVSVDNLAREALGALKSHAGSYTSSIDSAVRSNPIAVALIGAGAAWLLLGNRLGGGSKVQETPAMGHPVHDELPRWEGEGGPPPEYGAVAYRPTTSGPTADPDDDHGWSREAQGLRGRAMAALRRIEDEARSYYASLRGGSSSDGGRDYESERQSVISGFTSDLKARLSHGLDSLPPASRDRVIAARERAYAASIRAERLGRQMVTDPGRMMEEHPLVAGAVALALGAAAGAALPGTEVENRTFGADRDRLMDEASRLFRSERERAMGIAGSLGQELKAAAQDTLATATEMARETLDVTVEKAREGLDATVDRATEAADRLTDRAAEEVEAIRPASGGPNPVIG